MICCKGKIFFNNTNGLIFHLYMVTLGVLLLTHSTNEADCYTEVATCPCSKELWEQKSLNSTCVRPKRYACVLHKDNILVEICTTDFLIQTVYDGCPYVKVCNKEGRAEFGLPAKYEKCPENIDGCPNKTHKVYSIYQMYLYPACFITNRTNLANTGYGRYCTKQHNSSTSNGPPSNDSAKNDNSSVEIIVPIIVAFIVVAIIVIIAIWYWIRRRDFSGLRMKLIHINESEVKSCRETYFHLWQMSLPEDTNHFASVCLKEDIDFKNYSISSDGDKSKGFRIKSIKDLFGKNTKDTRYIFIRGEAGGGKTSFIMNLLDNWCKAKKLKSHNELSMFHFLFYIRLRNVDKEKASVIDLICHDSYLVLSNEFHDQIREVISNKKYRCLIILDGLHDWKPTLEVENLLKDPGIPNFDPMSNNVVLISSRPWKLEKISKSISNLDRMVDIEGFDDKGMRQTFKNISLHKFKLTEEESDKKFEMFRNAYQDSFASNTFLLTAAIILWYENAETGACKTYFFLSLLQYLFKREEDHEGGCRKSSTEYDFVDMAEILKHHKSLHRYKSVLIKLGKLAYDDLVADTHLMFVENELSEELGGKPNLHFLREIGLLSTPVEKSGDQNLRVCFVHPNIQELLAALYAVAYRSPFENSILDVYKAFELYNVITLISGFSLDMSYEISNRITEIARKEIDMYRDTFDYEKHSIIRRLYHLQLDCYQEASESKITGSPTCMTSDVYLRSEDTNESGMYVDLTKKLLREPMKHVKSLYLRVIPNQENGGIPDSTLKYFLQKNPQLESINIKSENDKPRRFESATLFNIVKKRALVLDNVILTTDTLIAIQQKVAVAQQLSTFGLWNIKEELCPSSQGLPSAMMQMIQVLPDIPHLTTLFVSCLYNKEDRQHFIKILPRIEHLRNFQYGGDRTKNDIDNSVVKTILASHANVLKKLWLNYLVLENDSLNGLDGMACIEKIELREVKTEKTGWENIVKAMEKIRHPFENTFVGTDIPEAVRKIVEASSAFEITFGKSHIHWGDHQTFCFKRVDLESS